MKKRKWPRIILNVVSSIIVISTLGLGSFLLVRSSRLDDPKIVKAPVVRHSVFLDSSGNEIRKLGNYEDTYVPYDSLPRTLIDALLAIEDISFYDHDGFDSRRILASLVNNIFNEDVQGASTVTQQLAKNLFLSPEKTLIRKLDELLLSLKLESDLSKEQILEYYFNMVCFDAVRPGIGAAARKYFSKQVSALTLAESAMLVGLVKSPTLYNPLKYPDRAQKRKDTVLANMQKYGYISSDEYRHAVSQRTESMVNPPANSANVYDGQAYLDCCYREISRLLQLDPYVTPLKVETYMRSDLQSYVDQISAGEVYDFQDDLQQVAAVLLDNDDRSVIAVSGGRDYSGEKLYNRAYDMLRSPASTIKPVFEYALAIEHLDYNGATLLVDEKTSYPNGQEVHNAGGGYLGDLTLLDALGYSRNTTALQTLMRLENRLGQGRLISYLDSVGLMDKGPFTLSYGLGGMTYGVSPFSLAAAYQMLASGGTYVRPAFIKRVTDLNSGQILYERELEERPVLSEATAFMVQDLLETMVENDYVGLNRAKPNGVRISAKTGTGAYDPSTVSKMGYPSGADKDLWLSGFSPDCTLTVWSGFDETKSDAKTYFGKGDSRRQATKEIFRKIMERACIKGENYRQPAEVVKVPLVKYADDAYLPNTLIPSSYVLETYVRNGRSFEAYPLPVFPSAEPTVFLFHDSLAMTLPPLGPGDRVYEKIYGPLGYHIEIRRRGTVLTKTFITGESYTYPDADPSTLEYEVKVGYEKLDSVYGPAASGFGNALLTPWQ